MELIQSFIEILEAAAERQAAQENGKSTVATHQPIQSQESAALEALLFNKPPSTVRSAAQN
ncbi:MAG TPA: hypothetical protein V6C90_03460 [Coleofasciculaceae cyanobacterium]|jgi:hypothetical protein